jgi:hypothetical protein
MRLRRTRVKQEGAATPLPYFAVQSDSGRVRGMSAPLSKLAVSLCLLWPALAGAQVTASDEYVARMDTDGDGRVALAEYQAWMGYAFEQMDANRDGQLAADELPGGQGKTISLVEYRESLAAMFRRQDTDSDGFLNAKELAAPPR